MNNHLKQIYYSTNPLGPENRSSADGLIINRLGIDSPFKICLKREIAKLLRRTIAEKYCSEDKACKSRVQFPTCTLHK